MKIQRTINALHPILINCIRKIQKEVVDAHTIPIKLFETGRDHDRHAMLINKGKTKDIISRHLYNLQNDPPLYATAVNYVYYDRKWSWNLRDSTVSSWYTLFGNLVLDCCPELQWGGYNRKSTNYCYFELRSDTMLTMQDKIPCVMP